MDNNDILRRLRYTFDFNDTQMIEVFGLAEVEVNRQQVSNWLKQEDDPAFLKLYDDYLAIFLNGLIVKNRGKKDDKIPPPEKKLNNNIILRKLKIALNLKTEDVLKMYKLAEKKVSEHEITSFFRNPKQPQYRECQDQYLRYFLNGLQTFYRK